MKRDSQDEFDRLLSRHFDGELAADESRRLSELIAGDAEHAREFSRAAAMHYQMRSVLKYDRAVSPPVVFDDRTEQGGQILSAHWPWFIGGAMFALTMALVAFLLWRPAGSDVAARGARPALPITNAAVAYLAVANGCNWTGSTPGVWNVGQSVQIGDEISLQEGIAEFRLASGASLSVEGPATLVVASPNSLILQEGKLTAHVPWKAADFQILAGTNRLTAADAEFGVQAKGNSVNVHVFAGEVTATLSPYSVKEGTAVSDDDFVGDEDLKPLPMTLRQTEAVELTSNADGNTAVRRFTAEEQQFASRNTMARQLAVTSRYVDAVKQSKPVAYWRFEAVENHEIRNEIPTGCPLKVTAKIYLRGDETNRVLESGYAFEKDNLVSTEPMDSFFNGDFSVELWVKPSHFHSGTLVSVMDKGYPPANLDPEEFARQNAKCGYGFRLETSPDFGYMPGTIFSMVSNPSQKMKADRCISQNNLYKLRFWQHVVVVRGSWGMQLYFDGQPVAAVKSFRKATLAEGQHLAVGRLQPFQDGSPFVGQLDELSIYDRVLTPQEILDHFKAVNEQATGSKQSIKTPEQTPAAKRAKIINDS